MLYWCLFQVYLVELNFLLKVYNDYFVNVEDTALNSTEWAHSCYLHFPQRLLTVCPNMMDFILLRGSWAIIKHTNFMRKICILVMYIITTFSSCEQWCLGFPNSTGSHSCWPMPSVLEFMRLKAMMFETSLGYIMDSRRAYDRVRPWQTNQPTNKKKLTWNVIKIVQIKFLWTITTVMPIICLVSRLKPKNFNMGFSGKLNYVLA